MGRSDRVRFVWSYKEGFKGLAVDRDLIYPSTFVPQQVGRACGRVCERVCACVCVRASVCECVCVWVFVRWDG